MKTERDKRKLKQTAYIREINLTEEIALWYNQQAMKKRSKHLRSPQRGRSPAERPSAKGMLKVAFELSGE